MGKNFPSLAGRLRLATRVASLIALAALFAASVSLTVSIFSSSSNSEKLVTPAFAKQNAVTRTATERQNVIAIFGQRTLQEVFPPKPVVAALPLTQPAPPPPPKPPELELVATLVEGVEIPSAYVRVKGNRRMIKLVVGEVTDDCKVLEINEGQIVVESKGLKFPIQMRKGS